jgi:hypothetical protein
VELDARVTRKGTNGADVAKEHASAAPPHDLSSARVIARQIVERVRRHAGLHQSLDDAKRSPGLGAARPKDQRHFHRDGGNPEPWTPGELLGSTPERLRARKKLTGLSFSTLKP